jgi:hypothetical protein
MPSSRTGSFSVTALLAAALTVLVAAAAGVGVALAASASSANPTYVVRLERLEHGAYGDAGDYATGFGPGLAGQGVWQAIASSTSVPNLAFIQYANTASGMVEVHLESFTGGAYRDAGDYTTHYPLTDAAKGTFELVGSSAGAPELGLIKAVDTPSKMVNVLLEAVSGGAYRSIGDYRSDFPASAASTGTWQLLRSSGGAPELALIANASGPVAVHLDALSGGAYQRVANYATPYRAAAGAAVWQLFGSGSGAPELGYGQLTPGPVTVRWATVSNGAYKAAGSYTSAFSPSLVTAGSWELFGDGPSPVLALVKTPVIAPTTTVTVPVTVTTVVTQPLPAPPPPKPHARARVRARLVISYRYHYAQTRILHVSISHFPRRARIAVRCYGRRCPRLAVTAGYRRLGGALHSLGGRVLGAGDLLEITVTAPGLLPERIGVRIRNGEKPRARLL